MNTQRMHVVTVKFGDGENLGQRIQSAYDDGFIMPDGSWRLIEKEPPTVQFGCVLDDVPFPQELENLEEGLREFVGDDWEIISVGDEEPHRDLDPCFDHLNQETPKRRDLADLLSRAAACIENPDSLIRSHREELIEDLIAAEKSLRPESPESVA